MLSEEEENVCEVFQKKPSELHYLKAALSGTGFFFIRQFHKIHVERVSLTK